jgi:hypothetical protein
LCYFVKLSQGKLLAKVRPGHPGANRTVVDYNASVVNFYNATGSIARFENKHIFILFLKTFSPTTTLAL